MAAGPPKGFLHARGEEGRVDAQAGPGSGTSHSLILEGGRVPPAGGTKKMLALQRFLAWFLVKFNREDEKGQSMVEYALIIGLVAIALVAVLGFLTGGLKNVFQNITNTLNGV